MIEFDAVDVLRCHTVSVEKCYAVSVNDIDVLKFDTV